MGCWHHTGHAMMQQEMMIIIITINIIVNIIFTINTIIANVIIICDSGDYQLCILYKVLPNIKATLELIIIY